MMALKFLIDKNIPAAADFFADMGDINLIDGRAIKRNDLLDIDILLVRSVTRVDNNLLDGTPVRFVGSATVGLDHINLDDLSVRGIGFAYAKGASKHAVTDYVMDALFLADGQDTRAPFKHLRTLGIIGLGDIGSLVASRARDLGLSVFAYDPFLQDNDFKFAQKTDLNGALDCDVISIHTPLTHQGDYPTYQMLNDNMAMIKPNAWLINTARGGVICEKSLAKHAHFHVILDVFDNEPNLSADIIHRADFITPHIAGHSVNAKYLSTQMLYDGLCDFFNIKPNKTAKIPIMPTPQNIILDAHHHLMQYLHDDIINPIDFDNTRKNYRRGQIVWD